MPDWKAVRFDLKFDHDKLRDVLVNIEAYRLSLNRLLLPQAWKNDLQKLYIVRAVHGTTAIEGNALSEEEVSRQITEGKGNGRRNQIHQQTENALEAFAWVVKEFSQPPRNIRLNDIRTIHELITSGSDERDNVPGTLRRSGHNVTVGSPEW